MNHGGGKCVCREKRLSLCLKGNRFARVSEEGFSVAQKSFVSSNTARYNESVVNNFESWRSQVAVEEPFPRDVLFTDDSKQLVLAFVGRLVILLIVTNGRLVNLSDGRLEQLWRSFSENVMSTNDSRLLSYCLRKYISNTARCNKWAQ